MAKRNRQNTGPRSDYAHPANPQLAQGMREIRSSNKSGPHLDGRFRRARTTQAMLLRISREG